MSDTQGQGARGQGKSVMKDELLRRLPFGDHRDLYVLIAGLLIGLALGPGGLKQVSPKVYNDLFIGNTQEVLRYQGLKANEEAAEEQVRAQLREQLSAKQGEGSSVSDLEGVVDRMVPQVMSQQMSKLELAAREAELKYLFHLVGLASSLVIGVIVLGVIETQLLPRKTAEGYALPWQLGQLVKVRYVLLAGWIAIMVARPVLIMQVPVFFTVVLVALALGLGFVPLGKKTA
ncbi:hypothetical protein KS4_30970 [Poriferisphaera corsica]|uniref:DUF4400 domain-containing protein n=1 Tax=Poriferisphaera corsica TaxID=2528020 RepID=A0A517YXR3_9BACT|nr:hypothetical protein [Poriferisphaera corsica]QDU35020.1 hypothetical protein KS4_30970 [Poriferisphaera corsica]